MRDHDKQSVVAHDFKVGGQGRLYKIKIEGTQYILKVYPARMYGQSRLRELSDRFDLAGYIPKQIEIAKMVDCGTVTDESGTFFPASLFKVVPGSPIFDPFSSKSAYLQTNSVSRGTRRSLAMQFVEGVYFLHSKGIIHCDLSPTNILVDETCSNITIIDLDGAGIWNERRRDWELAPVVLGQEGVPGFPPSNEFWMGKVFPQTDYWWSMMIVFFILFGNYPFFFLKDNTPSSLRELEFAFSADRSGSWPPDYQRVHVLKSFNSAVGPNDYDEIRRYVNGHIPSTFFFRTFTAGYSNLQERLSLQDIYDELYLMG